jgi:hypothetical protein
MRRGVFRVNLTPAESTLAFSGGNAKLQGRLRSAATSATLRQERHVSGLAGACPDMPLLRELGKGVAAPRSYNLPLITEPLRTSRGVKFPG